jgi:hypothetical protein
MNKFFAEAMHILATQPTPPESTSKTFLWLILTHLWIILCKPSREFATFSTTDCQLMPTFPGVCPEESQPSMPTFGGCL